VCLNICVCARVVVRAFGLVCCIYARYALLPFERLTYHQTQDVCMRTLSLSIYPKRSRCFFLVVTVVPVLDLLRMNIGIHVDAARRPDSRRYGISSKL